MDLPISCMRVKAARPGYYIASHSDRAAVATGCGHALLPWRYSRILFKSANRLTAGAGICSSGGVSSLRRMRVHHAADGAGALTAALPGYPTQIRVPAMLHWLQEGDASCYQAAALETGEVPPHPGKDGAGRLFRLLREG